MTTTPEPSHLLLEGGDKATLCGIKHTDKAFYPHLLARYVGRFQRGHAAKGKEFPVCTLCVAKAIMLDAALDVPDNYNPFAGAMADGDT